MNSIRIKNLRCFDDTSKINLKPLTIAVGKNSCGKSTLLRVFPLFKQSLESRTSEPLLWYGRYTDFGDYDISKRKNGKKTIDFEFNFDLNIMDHDKYSYHFIYPKEGRQASTNITISMQIKKDYIEKIILCVYNKNIIINYNNSSKKAKISINDVDYGIFNYKDVSNVGEILPNIIIENTGFLPSFAMYRIFDDNVKNHRKANVFFEYLFKLLENIKFEQKENLCLHIYNTLLSNALNIQDAYYEIENTTNKDTYRYGFVDDIKINKKNRTSIVKTLKDNEDKILDYIVLYRLPSIISSCNDYFSDFFSNVKYIAPIRATAERYYRKQGLDVEEVDSQGENVAVILQSMKNEEKKQFTQWLVENFEFQIQTKDEAGQISLYIKNGDEFTNIADTGFGYSQLLPILIMLWKSAKYKEKELEIVIEQPELHLHPKMQVKLIDVMVMLIKSKKPIKFLLETHSETIVNYLGQLIEEQGVDKGLVNILLVEQDNFSQISHIRQVNYTKEGYLESWPIDFF